MWQSSGMKSSALWEFPPLVLIAYGAKLNFLINSQHQWWRFITPIFLHAGLLHLLVNMYALWMIGPYVEKLYGSAKFVAFWVLTGIAGVAASYFTVVSPQRPLNSVMRFLLKTQDSPSIGASGALFGLIGVLFVFGIKFRHELPEGFKRAFGTGLLPMILLNLAIGYLGRGFIDNAAHLGGLLCGAALAVVVDYRRPGEGKGVAMVWRFLQVASLAIVAVSFVKIVHHFRDPIISPVNVALQPQPAEPMHPVLTYFKTLSDAHEAFLRVLKDRDTSQVNEAVEKLNALPSIDAEADDLRARMEDLLLKAKAFNEQLPPPPRELPAVLNQERKSLIEDSNKWIADYETWLKTASTKHGLTIAGETNDAQ
jgi:rhomboid protease GluP